MRQGNELPHGPPQRGALGGDLPLGFGLRRGDLLLRRGADRGHLPLGVRLRGGHLAGQRVDGLHHRRAQGLHARVVWLGEGALGVRAAAGKEDARLAVLAQPQRRAAAVRGAGATVVPRRWGHARHAAGGPRRPGGGRRRAIRPRPHQPL